VLLRIQDVEADAERLELSVAICSSISGWHVQDPSPVLAGPAPVGSGH